MHASFYFIKQILQLAYTTQACILNLQTYAMQAHEYAHIKCNQSKFMSLLPLLVCFSCPRILIHLFSSILLPLCPSMLLPLCPCPCPTSTSFIQCLPKLSYLCTISPPLASISIKCVLLIDAKACFWVDGWGLYLAFFMDITWLLEWHHVYSFLRYHT